MRTRRGFARFSILAGFGVLAAGALVFPATQHARQPVRTPAAAEPQAYYPGIGVQPFAQIINPGPHQFEFRLFDFREKVHPFILAGSTYTECDFRRADLRGVDLSRCCFWECDFHGANLNGANLNGATYDRRTRWPEGFDPQEAGARLVE